MGNGQKRKNKKQQLIIRRKVIVCFLLCFFTIILGYLILLTNCFRPKLNEITTNYISFNNYSSTDMLKIDKLHKMSDKKGIRLAKFKSLNFRVPGEKNLKYDIVVIPFNSIIEDKYVHYMLTVDGRSEVKTLDSVDSENGDEKIIYHGKNNINVSLYMWVSKEYKKKVSDISYEVKIKSR